MRKEFVEFVKLHGAWHPTAEGYVPIFEFVKLLGAGYTRQP